VFRCIAPLDVSMGQRRCCRAYACHAPKSIAGRVEFCL
jgi:hypothetical protein